MSLGQKRVIERAMVLSMERAMKRARKSVQASYIPVQVQINSPLFTSNSMAALNHSALCKGKRVSGREPANEKKRNARTKYCEQASGKAGEVNIPQFHSSLESGIPLVEW